MTKRVCPVIVDTSAVVAILGEDDSGRPCLLDSCPPRLDVGGQLRELMCARPIAGSGNTRRADRLPQTLESGGIRYRLSSRDSLARHTGLRARFGSPNRG